MNSPKAAFLAWTTSLRKILTIDNLQKHEVIIMDWCFMCKKCNESVNHLLLHYKSAREIWIDIFLRLDLGWVMLATVGTLLASSTSLGSPQLQATWKMIRIYILWCLWLKRNSRVF